MIYNTNNSKVKVLMTLKGYLVLAGTNGHYRSTKTPMSKEFLENVLAKRGIVVDFTMQATNYKRVVDITHVDEFSLIKSSPLVTNLDNGLDNPNK